MFLVAGFTEVATNCPTFVNHSSQPFKVSLPRCQKVEMLQDTYIFRDVRLGSSKVSDLHRQTQLAVQSGPLLVIDRVNPTPINGLMI